METLLIMLSTTSGQTGGVQEDALLTIGVLVEGISNSIVLLLLLLLLFTSCYFKFHKVYGVVSSLP